MLTHWRVARDRGKVVQMAARLECTGIFAIVHDGQCRWEKRLVWPLRSMVTDIYTKWWSWGSQTQICSR
jgi:hypothetical protein